MGKQAVIGFWFWEVEPKVGCILRLTDDAVGRNLVIQLLHRSGGNSKISGLEGLVEPNYEFF